MEAYAKLSERIKSGEYDDARGSELTGVLRFFNAIDACMGIHALTNRQRDSLWQEYFNRQTGRVMRFRTKQPGK
jgi:hypothetical protein